MKSAKVFIGLTFLLAFVVSVSAQDDVKVSKIRGETEDSIVFEIFVSKTKIKRGEDITVNYLVKNQSKKTIYFVTNPSSPTVRSHDIGVLKIYSQVIYPDAHFEYNYDLIKISPNKTYKNKLIIKAETYLSDKKYGFEDAAIQADFSYLFDISKLDGCKEADYSLPCLNEVYQNSKTLTLGNIVVDIEK